VNTYTYLVIYLVGIAILFFVVYKGFKSIDNERKVPYLWAALFGFLSFMFSLSIILLEVFNIHKDSYHYLLDTLSICSNALMAYFWFIYTDHLQGKKIIKSLRRKIIYTIPLILIEILVVLMYLQFINADISASKFYNQYYLSQIACVYFYIGLSSVRSMILIHHRKNTKERHELLTIASYGLYPLLFGLVQFLINGYDLISSGIVLAMLQAYFYVNSLEKQRDSIYSKLLSFSRLFLVTYFIDLVNNKTERLAENTYLEYQKFSKKGIEKRIKNYLEVANEYVSLYVHPDDKAMMYTILSKKYIVDNISDENPYFSHVYRQVFNGVTKWYRLYMILQSFEGEVKSTVLAIMDVDNDINKDIKQRKLIEDALEEAQRANNAKSNFLSNMSHDIRTPMNAILGYTAIANMYIDDKEKVSDCLNKIQTSGSHLLDLINNVLDMSRIESGKATLDEGECDFNQILQSITKIIHNQISTKNINFVLDIDGIKNFDIICDKLKLRQIIMNLVANAIKYTPKDGKVSLKIVEKDVDNDSSLYEFIISDNGIGMDQDFIKNIFEPFEREKTTTESGIEGTGLGLAIVKNLIDLMGGTIKVESTLGKGTVFVVNICFKLAKSHLDIDVEQEKLIFKNTRLLVVEDNDLNYEIIYEILTNLGLVLERASNGLEAYEKVNSSIIGYYDLILMDIQMPVMNGYDATKKIRSISDKRLANIPIIAMTANAFTEDIELALSSGMNAHVSKPIEFDKLTQTICKVLNIEE